MSIENINGVTVLGNRVIEDYTFIIGIIGAIVSIILLILCIMLTKEFIEDKCVLASIGSGITTILIIAFLIFCSVSAIVKPKNKSCWDVYIENPNAMQQIYDKYDIIEVNGDIYTISEKEIS